MGKKILVVDDEPAFLRMVDHVLTASGFRVLKATSGQEALRLLFDNKPDLVLLDVAMPGMDGWQTCSRIRDVSDVPIVILTGSQTDENAIVRGLDYGADDYLIKPVGNRELVARVRAILRRAELTPADDSKRETTYSDGYLTVNVKERKVAVNGERIRVTPREFRLLACLITNAGHVLSHRQLLEKVWGWEYVDEVDYIRIYILHLRQKLEPDPATPRYILTEPGFGYYFQKSSSAA